MFFSTEEDKSIVTEINTVNNLANAINTVIVKRAKEYNKGKRRLVQPLTRIKFLLGRKKLLKDFFKEFNTKVKNGNENLNLIDGINSSKLISEEIRRSNDEIISIRCYLATLAWCFMAIMLAACLSTIVIMTCFHNNPVLSNAFMISRYSMITAVILAFICGTAALTTESFLIEDDAISGSFDYSEVTQEFTERQEQERAEDGSQPQV